MAVLINKKVCDNARECSCIEECPNHAFYYDEENDTIAVKESLCTQCRICMIACEAGAVKVSRSDEEYNKIKKEYDEDIRTVEQLFVDRYGAASIDEKYLVEINNLEKIIDDANRTLLIELYNEEESNCLINSIPIGEIINKIGDVSYRKCNVNNIDEINKYNIKELPTLLLIKDNKIINKYEGFCNIKDKEDLFKKIENNN